MVSCCFSGQLIKCQRRVIVPERRSSFTMMVRKKSAFEWARNTQCCHFKWQTTLIKHVHYLCVSVVPVNSISQLHGQALNGTHFIINAPFCHKYPWKLSTYQHFVSIRWTTVWALHCYCIASRLIFTFHHTNCLVSVYLLPSSTIFLLVDGIEQRSKCTCNWNNDIYDKNSLLTALSYSLWFDNVLCNWMNIIYVLQYSSRTSQSIPSISGIVQSY